MFKYQRHGRRVWSTKVGLGLTKQSLSTRLPKHRVVWVQIPIYEAKQRPFRSSFSSVLPCILLESSYLVPTSPSTKCLLFTYSALSDHLFLCPCLQAADVSCLDQRCAFSARRCPVRLLVWVVLACVCTTRAWSGNQVLFTEAAMSGSHADFHYANPLGCSKELYLFLPLP